jgi:HK97 family phage major capsid protein
MTPEEIKAAAKAALEEGTKDIAQKAANAEKSAADVALKLEAQEKANKELSEKVAKLEAAPVGGVAVTKSDFGDFLGTKINPIVSALRLKGFFRNAEKSDEENREKAANYVKWTLALFKSFSSRNPAIYTDYCKDANIEGTDAQGGYLVPPEIAAELILAVREESFALRECTVFPMSSNETDFPAEDALVSAAFVDEAAAASASNPTFKQIQIKAKKAMALTAGISFELLQDSIISFVNILTDQMTYALAQLIDNSVINGISGNTADFKGLLVPSTAIQAITLAAGKYYQDLGYDNLSDAITLLPNGARARAKFAFSRYAIGLIRKIKDTTGQPIFANAISGEPNTVLGMPYLLTESVPGAADAATASKIFTVLGNFKDYYIGMRDDTMALELDPYTQFDKAMIRTRMIMRVGGNPIRTSSFAVIKAGATPS